MRPTTDETLLALAQVWSLRSTCPRRSTGAVISTFDGHVVSSGYNGSPRGMDHCSDVGCLMEGGHCVRSIHAEANAIVQAARIGVSVDNGYLYATDRPCVRCAILIIQVGIVRVVYARPYDTDGLPDHVAKLFATAGVECFQGDLWTPSTEESSRFAGPQVTPSNWGAFWAKSGGPNECTHGIAEGIPCPRCNDVQGAAV